MLLEFAKIDCTIFNMPRLSLALLGPPVITLDGQAITTFKTLKVQLLLAFLVVESAHPHRREELTGLLWPDQPEEAARANLRMSLSRLRDALQEEDLTLFLHTTRDAIRFNLLSDHWLDVRVFNGLMAECQAHPHERLESCEACSARLAQAVDLYRGDFLAGVTLFDSESFEDWVLMQRETLRQQAFSALETLIAFHDRHADYPALCRAARRQLELEPWHESAHRQLMRGLALSGDRDSALAQYEICRHVLEEELGIEPEVQTRTLYERIRAGELSTVELNAQGPRHNLPAQQAPFVGREQELRDMHEFFQQPDLRLLTLVGAGGMGKTRLALELGRLQVSQFRDGVFFVPLAPVTSASGIAPAIVKAMKLQLQGDLEAALMHVLRDKQLLLLLDNCEQLLHETEATHSTNFVIELLQAAPQVHILATSREPLQARSEQVYRLEGLDYGADATVEDAGATSAARMFLQSARRTLPKFKLDEDNVADVLRICRLVDGIPLGIELAAVWLGTLSPAEIASEIERSADFLMSEWHDVPARQQSMRAVFDWSWSLLNETEQKVFRQLSVFRGGFTREAAQAVTGTSLIMLTRLVRKSLISHLERGRYEIHELLRQFAAEQLDASPTERDEVEARHSKFYLNFVAAREKQLGRNEPRQAATEIRAEIDNVRQAWGLPHAQTQDLDRSAYPLWQFYVLTSIFSEGEGAFRLVIESLRAKLAGANKTDDDIEARRVLSKLLGIRAALLISLSQHDPAMRLAQEAVTMGQASGGIEGETLGHVVWGQAHNRKSQFLVSRPHFTRAMELASKDPTERSELLIDCEWLAYLWLGASSMMLDEYIIAGKEMTQGLQLCRKFGKVRGEMLLLLNLADIAREIRDFATADEGYDQAYQIAHHLNYRWGAGVAQLELGYIARGQGNYVLAAERIKRALSIFVEVGDRLKEAIALSRLGQLHVYMGNFDEAQRRLNESLEFLQEIESPDAEALGYFYLAMLAYFRGENKKTLSEAVRLLNLGGEIGSRSWQAKALVVIGHAHTGLLQLSEAASAYQQALELFEELGNITDATEPRAGLAHIALLENELADSVAYVEEILKVLTNHPRAGLDEPFNVYLTCYRVLEANHDPRAASVLKTAANLLDEYASHFIDEAERHAFLYNVPSHREIIQVRDRSNLARN
jgi:predicted ATPase/DNA-binding SARP family transcriptional activator